MKHASQYVADLAAQGRYDFTILDAVTALGGTLPAVRTALRRLQMKGTVATPYRGFYIVVPPEYRQLGSLPAEQFVPQLMAHIGEPYYAALLSAAERHGAAHHRPQAFQVMVRKNRRPILCGAVRVLFIARKDLAMTAVVEHATPRGMLRVASPEDTALELVGYSEQSGGLDNVAGVVSELAVMLDPAKLEAAARRTPVAWTQRLGYLLDLGDQRALADSLVPFVAEHVHAEAPLVRSTSSAGVERAARWKLAINARLEPDA